MENQVLNKVAHPLEPLTGEEILRAVAILKEKKNLTEYARFEQVGLNEPAKEVVINFKEGDPINREAFIIVLDTQIVKHMKLLFLLQTKK